MYRIRFYLLCGRAVCIWCEKFREIKESQNFPWKYLFSNFICKNRCFHEIFVKKVWERNSAIFFHRVEITNYLLSQKFREIKFTIFDLFSRKFCESKIYRTNNKDRVDCFHVGYFSNHTVEIVEIYSHWKSFFVKSNI